VAKEWRSVWQLTGLAMPAMRAASLIARVNSSLPKPPISPDICLNEAQKQGSVNTSILYT
jgi:hypothetical protein